jgi:hypothetical protein
VPARITKRPKGPKATKVFGSNGVFYRFLAGEEGPIEIKIDFGSVPTPASYYYADSLLLNLDQDLRMSLLSFGRRDANTNKFADRIDVAIPTKSLFGPFWASSRAVESTVDKVLEASGVSVPKPKPVSPPESLAPTVFANTIFAAVGETESTLDFYHLAPREIHLAKTQKKDIQLQPIIRVIVSTVLTKIFFDTLRPHAEQGESLPPLVQRSRRAIR